jgi:hypothetical protein
MVATSASDSRHAWSAISSSVAEIGLGGLLERRTLERNDALVALRMFTLVDGQRQHAVAQQFARRISARSDRIGHPIGIEARIGAQRLRRREIGDDHIHRTVGTRLEDELALKLQRRSEQHGDEAGLGHEARDRLGIIVPEQDLVEQRTELDDTPTHVERADLERHHVVIAGKAEFTKSALFVGHRTNPLGFPDHVGKTVRRAVYMLM